MYDATSFACLHRKTGVKLVPGEFEIENEESAKILLELGIVRSVSPPASVDEPEPEDHDDAVSEVREVEETNFDGEEEE